MRYVTKARGFTLVELLVVVAIIAILAAIIFPIMVTAQERSRKMKCLNNLTQLARGMRLYADDWGGRPPNYTSALPESNWYGGTYASYVWPEKGQLYRYTRNASLYLCPKDIHVRAQDVYNVALEKGQPAIAEYAKNSYPLSYSMSAAVGAMSLDAVRRPSQVMMLIHESRVTINDGAYAYTDDPTHKKFDTPSNTHYDGTTLAYVDGHAVWRNALKLEDERKAGLWHPRK